MSKKDKEKLLNLAIYLRGIPLYVYRKKHQKQMVIVNLFREKLKNEKR